MEGGGAGVAADAPGQVRTRVRLGTWRGDKKGPGANRDPNC